MAPTHLQLAALSQSLGAPPPGKPFTFCELACGQGFGTALMAAAHPEGRFWAFDFNPAQIANARRLAADAGLTNVTFEDFSFEQGVALPDDALPTFDIIALHGIYSWISPENRGFIVQFLEKKLKPGGLVYVSYNCMPGWAAVAPLQRLMREHANRLPDRSDIQVNNALAFAQKLKDGGAGYFAQNPGLAPRMEKMPTHNRNYLAHEYLNGHWHPLFHLDVAKELEPARLSFIGSATLAENLDAISVPQSLHGLLAETRDRGWQETIRDFASNKQFRRDIFARGALALNPGEAREHWLEMRFVLGTLRADVPLTVAGSLGSANLQPEVYAPLLDAMAKGPQTVRQILADNKPVADLGWQRLMQALVVLVGAGHAYPCLPGKGEGERQKRTRAFNAAVLKRAEHSADLAFLASPVTGAGHPLDRISQLFLSHEGQKGVDPAERVWATLSAQGQRLVKDGATLDSVEDNLSELRTRHAEFATKRLPILKTLAIA
jgi:SAM-dependent methyltransferase